MAARGGRRPGAGRKPKAFRRVLNETPIQAAEGKIVDRLPWLVDKLLALADGVHVERTLPDGENTIVYQVSPDRQAAEYLIDRILGRPLARAEQGEPGAFRKGFEIRLIRTDDAGSTAAS